MWEAPRPSLVAKTLAQESDREWLGIRVDHACMTFVSTFCPPIQDLKTRNVSFYRPRKYSSFASRQAIQRVRDEVNWTLPFITYRMSRLEQAQEKQEWKPCILLTNDDGVDSRMLLALSNCLRSGYDLDVVVIAPKTNQSACSHRLTLAKPMELCLRDDLSPMTFSLDGSPADCVITATEPNGVLARDGRRVSLVVSGPNVGPNLAQDVLHSGTFSGARQAGFYGVPSLACSLAASSMDPESQDRCVGGIAHLVHVLVSELAPFPPNHGRLLPALTTHHHGGVRDGRKENLGTDSRYEALMGGTAVIDETRPALELVWSAFAHGDLLLNVNFPAMWERGRWRTTHLGAIFYRDVFRSRLSEENSNVEMVTIGEHGRPEPMFGFENSDLVAVKEGYASITTLQTWPETHPLQANAKVVQAMALEDPEWGLPRWITFKSSKRILADLRG